MKADTASGALRLDAIDGLRAVAALLVCVYHRLPEGCDRSLEAFRWSLLGGVAPSPLGLTITVASSAVLAIFGLWSFRRMERRFADVV